jgi:hypothetical protein
MTFKKDNIFPAHLGEVVGYTAASYSAPDDNNLSLRWKFWH